MSVMARRVCVGVVVALLAAAEVSAQSLSDRGIAAQGAAAVDSTANGVVIGAAAGAGTALGLLAVAYARCDAGCEAPSEGPMIVLSAALGGGVGAVAGWLIDRARRRPATTAAAATRHPTLALSIGPIVSPSRHAVHVRVGF